SPTVSSSHFLPLAAIPSDLLTTALPPLTIFLVASFLIAFALLKAFSAKFQSFFFLSVPPLNLRSEEHTSELQSRFDLVCRLLLLFHHLDLLSFPTRRSSDLIADSIFKPLLTFSSHT